MASGDEAMDAEQVFMPDRTPAQWDLLVLHAERRIFHAGEVVIRQGDVDRALCIVVDGSLETVFTDGRLGREALALPSGSVVGEVAFLDGRPRGLTVRALTDGELLRLSWESFERLRSSDPGLAWAIVLDLARILAARLRRTDDFIRGWLG